MSWPAHSRFLTELAAAFPSLCTIQSPANTNTKGDISEAPWAAVAGLSDIACRVSPASAGRETRSPDMTYSTTTHIITLAGRYDTILPHYRALVDAVAYDIESITGDGSGVMTRLATRIVTT